MISKWSTFQRISDAERVRHIDECGVEPECEVVNGSEECESTAAWVRYRQHVSMDVPRFYCDDHKRAIEARKAALR